MADILFIPSDYWAFLIGLQGFLLFLLCLALNRQEQEHDFFTWLGFFAIFLWVHSWLSLLQPVLGVAPALPGAALLLALAAVVCLGISGVIPWRRSWLRYPALAGCLLLAGLALWHGMQERLEIFLALFLSLGTFSSFAAAASLDYLGRRRQAPFLRLAAPALAGCGLAFLLACSHAFATLQKDAITAGVWAVIQVYQPFLQVVFGFFLTFALWLAHQQEIWSQQGSPGWAKRLGPALLFVAGISLLLTAGGISVGIFGRSLDEDMRQELARRVRMLAAALPVENVRALTGTPADQGTPAYEGLKSLLAAVRKAAPDCRFIYLLGFRDKQPFIFVDNEPADSPDVSPPGQVYEEASPRLQSMAFCPQAFVEGPETDRWGTWITAFEPIYDPADDRFLAYLGLDIDVRDWQRRIALQKLLPIGIILLMMVLFTVFYLSQQQLVVSALRVTQSEERYRSLVEGNPNGVGLFDLEGRCLAMNRRGLDMLGLSYSQMEQRPLAEFWPAARQRLQEAWQQVAAGEMVCLEAEFPADQNRALIWQAVFNPMRDHQGKVVGSVGIFVDNTEAKAAEQEIRASQALLHSLLAAIPDPLVVIDRDYRIVYSNNVIGTLPSSSTAIEPTCFQIFHRRTSPCPDCPVVHVFATGQTLNREVFNTDLGRFFEIRAFPVLDTGGQVNLVIEYIRDITERRQAEEELKSREAKLQSIFRAAPVGIGLVVNRVLMEVNERLCQLTGYSAQELVGADARLLYPSQEDYDFVGREKYRQIAQKGVGTVETRWRRKDGSVIDVLLSSAPLWQDPQSAPEILFTVLDITEQKKLESLRANLDKMESLGIMAGGIAHDFNNVLMAILGNISLLGMATTPKEVREGLQEVEQACRQAMLLAKQLLTFAKGGSPIKEVKDIGELVEESARLGLSGSKAKTVFTWPPDLWQVNVDSGQMHQVFTNLFINADQAMPGGGQISVAAENCRLSEETSLPLPPGDYVLVRVSDQGVGIPPEHLDKIFDPYFSTKQKGSGLGLTMVYSILKQHGGFITCESRLGQGTTFSIYLPAVQQQPPQALKPGTPLVTGQGCILVLEDEPSVRAVMAKMLAKLGYQAVFAQDGQELLDRYDQGCEPGQPFAGVILDLTIPGGMGGLEACQRLRQLHPEVKTIVSSGYADDPVLADYRSYGFDGAIAKPYRLQELSTILHQVLRPPAATQPDSSLAMGAAIQ